MPAAAMMKLQRGVDFDAPNGKPVDILLALLVPMDFTEIHLRMLSGLCAAMPMLDDPRASTSPEDTLSLLNREAAVHAA